MQQEAIPLDKLSLLIHHFLSLSFSSSSSFSPDCLMTIKETDYAVVLVRWNRSTEWQINYEGMSTGIQTAEGETDRELSVVTRDNYQAKRGLLMQNVQSLSLVLNLNVKRTIRKGSERSLKAHQVSSDCGSSAKCQYKANQRWFGWRINKYRLSSPLLIAVNCICGLCITAINIIMHTTEMGRDKEFIMALTRFFTITISAEQSQASLRSG